MSAVETIETLEQQLAEQEAQAKKRTAEFAKMKENLARLKKEGEQLKQEKGSISKIVREMKGASSDQIAIVGILKRDEAQTEAMYTALDNPRDAAMIHSTAGGHLGTHGNKDAGIPRASPLTLDNYEAYNKAQLAIFILAQDLKVKPDFLAWERNNQHLWDTAKLSLEHMMQETDLAKRKGLQHQFHEDMATALLDEFDFENVPITEDWTRKEYPVLWTLSQKAREIFITRTQHLENLALIMGTTGEVVKPGRAATKRTQSKDDIYEIEVD